MREVDQILQFADGFSRQSKGIIDDVLMNVDHVYFRLDFVVLEIEEDKDVPLILGRPFLATSNSLLDVKNRCLILKVNDEEVVVDMNSNSESHSDMSWFSFVLIHCFDRFVKDVHAAKLEEQSFNQPLLFLTMDFQIQNSMPHKSITSMIPNG